MTHQLKTHCHMLIAGCALSTPLCACPVGASDVHVGTQH